MFPVRNPSRVRRRRKRATLTEIAEFFGGKWKTVHRWTKQTPIDRFDIQSVLAFVVGRVVWKEMKKKAR